MIDHQFNIKGQLSKPKVFVGDNLIKNRETGISRDFYACTYESESAGEILKQKTQKGQRPPSPFFFGTSLQIKMNSNINIQRKADGKFQHQIDLLNSYEL